MKPGARNPEAPYSPDFEAAARGFALLLARQLAAEHADAILTGTVTMPASTEGTANAMARTQKPA